MNTIDDVLFFDVETTGLPKKGQTYEKDFADFPYIVQIAWSFNGVEKDYIIKPDGWVIPEEATKIHGISNEIAESCGENLNWVLQEFFYHAYNAKFICAHNIYFDSSIIKANVLRTMGQTFYDETVEISLHKSKRIDTMMKTIKFVGAKQKNGAAKTPTLVELFTKIFPDKTFDAHDALEDVLALKQCLPELIKAGIIELKQKEYPTEPIKDLVKKAKEVLKPKEKEISPLQKAINFEESIPENNFMDSNNPLLDEDNF